MEYFLNYSLRSALFPKSEKDTRRKENYKPIPLMNIDANFLSNIVTNYMQQHIKRIIHHDQVEFIPRIQVGSTYENNEGKKYYLNLYTKGM